LKIHRMSVTPLGPRFVVYIQYNRNYKSCNGMENYHTWVKKSIFLSPTCYLSSCLNRSTTRLSRSSSMVLQHTHSAPACSSASSLVRSTTHAGHNDGKGAGEGEIPRTTRGRTSSYGRRGEGRAWRREGRAPMRGREQAMATGS
jgi:hypothetical protein